MDSIFSIEKRNKRSHNAVRTAGAWARRSSNFSHGLPPFKFSVCRGIVTFYETMKAFVASSLCEFPIYFRCIVSISNTLLFQHHLWVIVQSLSLSFLPAPPSLAMSFHSESCCFLHLTIFGLAFGISHFNRFPTLPLHLLVPGWANYDPYHKCTLLSVLVNAFLLEMWLTHLLFCMWLLLWG